LPPGKVHSGLAGPWSLDWLDRHKRDTIGDGRHVESKSNKLSQSSALRVSKKKGSGYIRHCAQNLKRIARLSKNDHREVLRALRKSHRRRKGNSQDSKEKVNGNECSSQSGSQVSMNNDWTNWLVLHGNDKTLSDDVRGMGKVMGLNFKGDKNNKFDVLSGVGRTKTEGDGKEG